MSLKFFIKGYPRAGFSIKNSLMDLNTLLTVKTQLRDSSWDDQFFQKLQEGSIRVLTQDPQEGPEGFPYLLVTTYGDTGFEPFQRVAHWCADKGVGIVLNPTEDGEDYLFTFGMLWNYKHRGEFFSTWVHEEAGQIKDQMVVRQITENYWPKIPRQIFKEFLLQQNILRPRVCLFSQSSSSDPELGFSMDSLGHPPERERKGIMEAFSWFFPRHYSLVLVSEKDIGTHHFTDI